MKRNLKVKKRLSTRPQKDMYKRTILKNQIIGNENEGVQTLRRHARNDELLAINTHPVINSGFR